MFEKPKRELPVRPNLDHLRNEAKTLHRALRRKDPEALEDFQAFYGRPGDPAEAKLSDAQWILARSYGLPSWPRLALACKLIQAIWEDDLQTVRRLVRQSPSLLHENARGVQGNWGMPMAYAANLGRDEMVSMLRELGSQDLQHAFDRACLQGKLSTARLLHAQGARLGPGSVMGPCETLNGEGLAFLLELGAKFEDEHDNRLAPVGLILQTYSRNPVGKHRCLEIAAEQGVELPDTPAMAVHRGRIDLLESHLKRDPGLLERTFAHREIYPLELGCSEDPLFALHGTPLDGGTLLHLCVDFDEIELGRWLLEQGMDPDTRAAVDAKGFGGHTALFGCVVSQSYINGRQKDGAFAQMLLDAGAKPWVRACLAKELRFVEDETRHEYRHVTPLEWGERFHEKRWVNRKAMELIREAM